MKISNSVRGINLYNRLKINLDETLQAFSNLGVTIVTMVSFILETLWHFTILILQLIDWIN